MRFLDKVRLISDKYEKEGAKKGDLGNILEPEIRWGTYYVVFSDEKGRDYAEICADVFDLEFVYDAGVTDEKYHKHMAEYDNLDPAIACHWGPNAYGYIFVGDENIL